MRVFELTYRWRQALIRDLGGKHWANSSYRNDILKNNGYMRKSPQSPPTPPSPPTSCFGLLPDTPATQHATYRLNLLLWCVCCVPGRF
jgi:hypothetical protein